ncbi:Sphingolipid long chain base-responsive protein-like protein [Hapsidospora chrysogenum ATCC 11550]|uniref:Sphingolipid long chain base-responsive protein-like protein n=1 Tax=Hapsidospora chrysogenum (strain ATCC 11550 / CBS 779.69 / DSM 880 / IAM 14645 / JCM 23072 / IMI 49137) TaxID=857340 RepID=A0A086T0V5_HAPC1|nr:Sphingolipid long chain base-responsive protein-like protein [Hapsidospora chrysogenum ATCC 11550]
MPRLPRQPPAWWRFSHIGNSANIAVPSRSRSLSFRSGKGSGRGPAPTTGRPGLSFSSLRGTTQPELSRRLFKLIKSENNLVTAHETAGRERIFIATQLSEWGEQTGDDAVSDLSDKVGVILSELGEQEEAYAHALDDSRAVLKAIRNTEKSVQPSRDNKAKITDDIHRLKTKEPQSAKLVVLEQELIRAEAENLVAEAQLTNMTRQKLKEAYDAEFLATIERAEKQIILAKHGRRLLNLLDDSPVVPGDTRAAYEHGGQARQILNDAEDDLRDWRPSSEPLGAEEVSSPTKTTSKEESLQEPLQEEPATESAAEAAGALPGEEGTRTTEVAG